MTALYQSQAGAQLASVASEAVHRQLAAIGAAVPLVALCPIVCYNSAGVSCRMAKWLCQPMATFAEIGFTMFASWLVAMSMPGLLDVLCSARCGVLPQRARPSAQSSSRRIEGEEVMQGHERSGECQPHLSPSFLRCLGEAAAFIPECGIHPGGK